MKEYRYLYRGRTIFGVDRFALGFLSGIMFTVGAHNLGTRLNLNSEVENEGERRVSKFEECLNLGGEIIRDGYFVNSGGYDPNSVYVARVQDCKNGKTGEMVRKVSDERFLWVDEEGLYSRIDSNDLGVREFIPYQHEGGRNSSDLGVSVAEVFYKFRENQSK